MVKICRESCLISLLDRVMQYLRKFQYNGTVEGLHRVIVQDPGYLRSEPFHFPLRFLEGGTAVCFISIILS